MVNRQFEYPAIAMIRLLTDERCQRRLLSSASRAALLIGFFNLLAGCGTLGQATIVSTRTPVNEAVATTARQQTLMNIVRVYHNESPLILDIAETDDLVAVGGSATGGVAGFGSPINSTSGQTGSVSGVVSAGDTVTNRYIPLQGQALISQLSSQITVETVNALYDSDWPLHSLIDFSFDRLTADSSQIRLAEEILVQLDMDQAISLATAKSAFSKEQPKQVTQSGDRKNDIVIQTQAPPAGGGDTLNVYFTPGSARKPASSLDDKLWKKLYQIYERTQPDQHDKLMRASTTIPNVIELRNSPITQMSNDVREADYRFGAYLGPVARTRTALGILKYITSQPKAAFISESDYRSIKAFPWNSDAYFRRCPASDSYILDPYNKIGHQDDDKEIYFHVDDDFETSLIKSIYNFLTDLADQPSKYNAIIGENEKLCSFTYTIIPKLAQKDKFSVKLSGLRRFILIVKSATPIAGAFTSWTNGGDYFSIMPDDRISQRNLMLVSQFLTIQATSTPTPSLTTISPSGR